MTLAAGDRARRHRGRLVGHGLVGTPAVAARRRPRLRCRHRPAALDLPHRRARQSEPGVETWENDSWKEAGNANVWAPMSADEELGYVYLPVSTPTNDYYGGDRPGDGLYGESLVCLDAATGKKVWHYQLVHHGLWDYDPPAAPNLIDITVGGKRDQGGRAGDQAGLRLRIRSRHRRAGLADRGAAGAGLQRARRARLEDAAVSDQAAPFDIQGVRDEDLIDLTPEIHKEAIDIAAAYDHGPLFTPPSERGTIQVPGVGGGGNWSGAAIDPETGMLYVGTYRLPFVVTVRKPEPWEGTYDFIGMPLSAGAARAAAAQAAVRQHRRHRHEQRRTSLADSGRARRSRCLRS